MSYDAPNIKALSKSVRAELFSDLGELIKGGKVPWTAGKDVLCVFTDGFPDATGAKGERYGEDRLLTLIRHHKGETAEAIVEAAFRDIESFAGSAPDDDRTLVIVRR